MKLGLAIILFVVLLSSSFSVFFTSISVKAEVENDFKSKVIDTACEIIVGTPISISYSFKGDKDFTDMPYTFMEVKIETTEKTRGNLPSIITIYYEGGLVNDELYIASRNPWGKIILNSNEKVKLFLVKGDTYPQFYYVIGYENLAKDLKGSIVLSAPSSYYIYEEYGAGFEWTGDYYRTYADIDYYTCPYLLPSYLSGTSWRTAISAGFSTWNGESYSNINFHNCGDRAFLAMGNGFNEVQWNDLESSTLAATLSQPQHGQSNEFDIMFNTDFQWSIGSQSGKYDIQNALTHEAGHAIGLEDMYNVLSISLTMYYWINPAETLKCSLDTGDKAGAQFICPTYSKPIVNIVDPYDYETMIAYYANPIYAYVSVTQGSISQVQYKATSIDYSYQSSWTTMTYSSGAASGSWNPGSREGYHYITVRAKSSYGIYGYDVVEVYCQGPI